VKGSNTSGTAAGGSDGKSKVLAAVDIVELIGKSVSLKRRGKDYVGLCPFHQEKTPSFHVSPTRQFFICYGCKASGNAIDFVIKRDRVEFLDALRQLAQEYGVELPRLGASKQNTSERQALLEAHSAACALFEKLLSHPQQGAAARDYLKSRGFDDESVKRFQIGLAADSWDTLLRSPLMKKFPPAQLALAGLVKPREGGGGGESRGFYDTFRNRLMFPIRDEAGRVMAFGGRVMPGSQDPAKYLNSPETPLFSKSRAIYGLDLARQKIVETRVVAVVEGYTDVVMAHQFGATNVVSILGTAMTEQHVGILRRFADKIVLLFDADTAGDTAVDRTVELFLTQPVEIAIASMPEGIDPDEYLMAHGAEGFQRVLDTAQDALTYKWRRLTRDFAAEDDLTGRQKAIREYLDLLASARGSGPIDPIRWGQILARVNRLTEMPVADLNQVFRLSRAKPTRAAAQPAPESAAPIDANIRAQRWILGALLSEPHRWREVQAHVHVEDFSDPMMRTIAEAYWSHQRDEGEPVLNEFLSALSDGAKEVAIELVQEVEQLADTQRTLADALAHLAQQRRREQERKLVAELRRTSDAKRAAAEGNTLGNEPGQHRDDQDEIALLAKLQEQARRPDLGRGGR
jgi:DNA primase